VHIGRNCRIDPGVGAAEFARRRRIRSGETISVGRGPGAAAG
jgi:hypothetical protein